MIRVMSGSSAPKLAVEVGERRHHLQHDDRHQHQRERHQDRRIHERRHRLALHGRDDLRVLDVAAQHGVQVAAALAGQERRRVDARKQIALRLECVGQRRPRSHLVVHVVQHAAEHRGRHAPLQEIERLHERHPGLEQRRQFLIEDQELAHVDPGRLRQVNRQASDRALRLQRQNVQALLFQLVAQPGFVLRRVDAFDDLAVGGGETAAKLHAQATPRRRALCPQGIVSVDIIGMKIIPTYRQREARQAGLAAPGSADVLKEVRPCGGRKSWPCGRGKRGGYRPTRSRMRET